jgi:hypothetical protein
VVCRGLVGVLVDRGDGDHDRAAACGAKAVASVSVSTVSTNIVRVAAIG